MESAVNKSLRWWLLPAVVAIALLFLGEGLRSAPGAGSVPDPRADAIIVVPVQLGRDAYGLVMVDTIGKTLWVYEISARAPKNQLRLLAARDWQYDQLLTEYNTGEPRPSQVKQLLEKLDTPQKVERRTRRELEELAQPAID
ncbi:MAG: hypothetical protein DRP65_09850 [Planctomycetota bacterium]|nr:MAG: hypothetical protein DRP65_09850 [Planctomycetota bacterium]